MVKTELVNAARLREGDRVLQFGMVILLGERQVYRGRHGRPVYHFPGQVMNMAEVFRQDHITAGLLKEDGKWPVQGDDLTYWERLVPGELAAPVNCDHERLMCAECQYTCRVCGMHMGSDQELGLHVASAHVFGRLLGR